MSNTTIEAKGFASLLVNNQNLLCPGITTPEPTCSFNVSPKIAPELVVPTESPEKRKKFAGLYALLKEPVNGSTCTRRAKFGMRRGPNVAAAAIDPVATVFVALTRYELLPRHTSASRRTFAGGPLTVNAVHTASIVMVFATTDRVVPVTQSTSTWFCAPPTPNLMFPWASKTWLASRSSPNSTPSEIVQRSGGPHSGICRIR